MNTINLTEIFIINSLGILLIAGNIINKYFNIKRNVEDRYLFWISVCIMLSCIIESIVYTCYGRIGLIYRLIIYFGSVWLFFSIFLIGPLWVLLLEKHNQIESSKLLQSLLNYISLLGVAVLVINFFKPLVFYVDAESNYHRGQFFWLYVLSALFFFFAGISVYVKKRKISMIPFFPAIQIFIPVLAGMMVEILVPGVTVIWASCSVSVTLMIMALQNENICRDKLTGLFNRYYLERINLKYADKGILCFMMIDINGFKQINDKFGHSEGDRGLLFVSDCVTKSVGDKGSVIRYAGDEFIVLLNTKDYREADKCIERINENLAAVNQTLKKDYSLSLSIGYEIFDMKLIKMEEILEVIDKKMYQEKKKYYSSHDRRNAINDIEENIQTEDSENSEDTLNSDQKTE